MLTAFMPLPKSLIKFEQGEKQVSENSLLINNFPFTFILLDDIFIINLKNHHLANFQSIKYATLIFFINLFSFS